MVTKRFVPLEHEQQHNSEHTKNITMHRIIQKLLNESKTTHNDAELGAKVRILCQDIVDMKDILEISEPVTKSIVDEAMRQVAKDVRAPFVVRKGIIKKPKKTGLTQEGFDKW